jgi:hypothetical protein
MPNSALSVVVVLEGCWLSMAVQVVEKQGLTLKELVAESGAQLQHCWQIVGKNECLEAAAAVRRNAVQVVSSTELQMKN